jgi:hypothetical protein
VEIRAEMTEITPAMALEWMERHRKVVAGKRVENGGKARDNRKIRWGDDGVAGYARDMRAGKWRRNGETVKIAWDDTIPDGQHRLYACMEAKVPFWCLVVTGVDPEDQDTIDIGIGRKFADQLAIKNEPNAVILASVTRWSLRWLHGVRSGTNGGGSSYKPTQQEMLDFLAVTPHLRDADDSFDATYATFYFRAPDEFREALAEAAVEPVNMSERWQAAIERIGSGEMRPAEQAMADQLAAMLEDPSPDAPKIMEV